MLRLKHRELCGNESEFTIISESPYEDTSILIRGTFALSYKCTSMNNNNILCQLRFTFQLSDKRMVNIFNIGSLSVNQDQVVNWLEK
ncbi:MAG: DUF1456 family protein [Bacteroidota bacterium]